MAKQECAHGPCSCTLEDGEGIQGDDGQHYCSAGCKDGQGCHCPECGCRMDTVDGNESSEVPML